MGGLGDLGDKAGDLAKQHPEQADKGIERAEQLVDEHTGDRFDAQTDKASDTVERGYGGGEGDQQDAQEPQNPA